MKYNIFKGILKKSAFSNVKLQCPVFRKITRHANKQKNMTHKKEKN